MTRVYATRPKENRIVPRRIGQNPGGYTPRSQRQRRKDEDWLPTDVASRKRWQVRFSCLQCGRQPEDTATRRCAHCSGNVVAEHEEVA